MFIIKGMKKVIEVKVIPNAGKEEIIEGEPLIVKVKEPAEKGRANDAVVRLLSRYFKGEVRIIRGESKRRKVVEIEV
ncbi:MAG: DUF167 domain-containing protein [bacterium]